MLLKKEYDTDADSDEDSATSTGDSGSDDDQVLDPKSRAHQKLPSTVRKQLLKLSGQVESLHDENKKLKEVCQSFLTAYERHISLVPNPSIHKASTYSSDM